MLSFMVGVSAVGCSFMQYVDSASGGINSLVDFERDEEVTSLVAQDPLIGYKYSSAQYLTPIDYLSLS